MKRNVQRQMFELQFNLLSIGDCLWRERPVFADRQEVTMLSDGIENQEVQSTIFL